MNKIKLSEAANQYGASSGRRSYPVTGKCQLQEMRIDSGGYDSGSAYWGTGNPMYVCQDTEGNQFFIRAKNREQAKEEIIYRNKNVKFYR